MTIKIGFAAGALALGATSIASQVQVERGCADHWQVELDPESFAHNGAGKVFTSAELAILRAKIETALRTAAADACIGKKVAPSYAATVRRVRVFSASGATKPHFYPAEKGALSLEWVFAEEGLAVPPRAALVGALVCWADPAEKVCSGEGD